MSDTSTDHGNVVAELTMNVPVACAFCAFADENERSSWAAPTDTAVFIYEKTDFRAGGRDIARCGAKTDPRFLVETR